jgi:predicted patatin/cPLA2 family phospholipase
MTRALVVEGGGMRGAYAAGALVGLLQSSPEPDAMYASSSGACSAAYLAAHQPEGVTIWKDHLHGSRLLRASNVLRGRPYLDLDYLVDEVFARRVPLDVPKLRAAKHPLFVTMTRARDGAVEYHDLRAATDPLAVLRATAALPIAYPRAVRVDGEDYVDGGLGDPIPVQRALDDGADDVTVVLTKPLGYRRKPADRFSTWLAARSTPGIRRAFETLHERYNAALSLLESPPRGVTMRVVAPSPELRLSRLMHSATKLRAAVGAGFRDGQRPQVVHQ